MDKSLKERIAKEVQVHLENHPDSDAKSVFKFVCSVEKPVNLINVKANSLRTFIRRAIDKFRDIGNTS